MCPENVITLPCVSVLSCILITAFIVPNAWVVTFDFFGSFLVFFHGKMIVSITLILLKVMDQSGNNEHCLRHGRSKFSNALRQNTRDEHAADLLETMSFFH
jgi:hypothetical protein